MNQEEIKAVLDQHEIWLQNNNEGKMADLQGADLQGADLQGANLQGANLQGANLQGANLRGVDLQRANLQRANLQDANMQRANLQEANMQGANLRRADLHGAEMPPLHIPQSGLFHAFKKVMGGVVLELLISAKKPRTASYVGRKCRCQKAKVLKAYDAQGKELSLPNGYKFYSGYRSSFKYKMGEWVEEPNYNGDPRVECAPGIHFFMTKEEAEEYVL